MSEAVKNRAGDQPLPTGGQECVQDALIAFIEERKQLGIERYRSPLMTYNGRNSLQDALEEALDLTVYLMQVRMEWDGRATALRRVSALVALGSSEQIQPGSDAQRGYNLAMDQVRHAIQQADTPAPTDLEIHSKAVLRQTVSERLGHGLGGAQWIEEIYDHAVAPLVSNLQELQAQLGKALEAAEPSPGAEQKCGVCGGSTQIGGVTYRDIRICADCMKSPQMSPQTHLLAIAFAKHVATTKTSDGRP